MPNQKGITLLLTLFILFAILSAAILIINLVLRQGKTSQEVGYSEIAFYSAEAGTEKILYEINKNKVVEDKDILEAWQGSLSASGGTWKVVEIKKNDRIPDDSDHFQGTPGEVINSGNPLKVKLNNKESFQLNLDLKIFKYPDSLDFNWTGDSLVIIYSWLKDGGDETSRLENTPPFNLTIDPNRYYIFRINNLSTSDITYTLTPSNRTLPLGVLITVSGRYKDLNRQIETDNPRWQIY
jgi:hypothetical protein